MGLPSHHDVSAPTGLDSKGIQQRGTAPWARRVHHITIRLPILPILSRLTCLRFYREVPHFAVTIYCEQNKGRTPFKEERW